MTDYWWSMDPLLYGMFGENYVSKSITSHTGTYSLDITTTATNIGTSIPAVVSNGYFIIGLPGIFGGDDFERKKFGDTNRRNLKLNLKMSIAQSVSMPLIQFTVALAFAANTNLTVQRKN